MSEIPAPKTAGIDEQVREKAEFDVLARIERERTRRNWTEYMLAKNSQIAQSTISTWYRRQLQLYR